MKVVVIQPPYPANGIIDGAIACLSWIQMQLDQLSSGEQDLVLLPEYANAPGIEDRQGMRSFANENGAGFLEQIGQSAKRLDCLIVAGTVMQESAQWLNRTLVFDASGEIVFHYDKIHLTTMESRDLGLTAGPASPAFEHHGIRIGFATCFDLYFPEHFVTLAAQQVDLVLCPSYQRSESAERIRTISQVRALDTGCYLVRSSYAMPTPDYGGHSLIAAPDGALIGDAANKAEVLTAEFDPHQKFIKPASHGQRAVEHRALIESHRQPETYRT